MLIYVVVPGDRNVNKKISEKILKYAEITILILRMWDIKIKSDANNNSGNWRHFKIFQTISEQHKRKARNQGKTKNCHLGHGTLTMGSANVKTQNS
jgi:hypothetical protein